MIARSALFDGTGAPLRFVEESLPALCEGETLVRVRLCALCRSDLHTFFGRRIEPTPSVLGHEILGDVVASRSGVPVGTRVTWGIAASCGDCFFCLHDLPQKCERLLKYGHSTERLTGGLSTHVLLRRGTPIYPVPEGLSDEVAVLANCSTATAAAVVRVANPAAGSVVVVFGAGVLGVTATAMLTAVGHTVMVLDPVRPERGTPFGAAGCYAELQDLKQAVQQWTSGRGADACIELSGARAAAEACLDLVRIGGTVVWAGTASPVGEVALAPEKVVRRWLTLRGVHNYAPHDLGKALEFLAEHAERFRPLMGESFGLDEAEAAFRRAETAPGVRVLVRPSRRPCGDNPALTIRE